MKKTKGQHDRTGTSHFLTYSSIREYYIKEHQEGRAEVVDKKIADGEVSIGPPPIKGGQTLTVDPDGRYWIIE